MKLSTFVRSLFKSDTAKLEDGVGRVETMDGNKRLLLILIGSLGNKPFSGAVRLTKTVFLIQSESWHLKLENSFSYSFYRSDLGPFDAKIYCDLADLEAQKLITVGMKFETSGDPEKVYTLTNEGKSSLKSIKSEVSEELKAVVNKWAIKTSNMTRYYVLRFVHDQADVKSYEIGDFVKLPFVK